MVNEVTSELPIALVIPARLILGFTLALAGAAKLRYPSGFAAGVAQYAILPATLARLYGYLLPALELVTGMLLLVGVWVQLAAVLATAMLSSFAIAVGSNLARKRKMPCFCFGMNAADTIGWHTFTRIVLLLVASIALVFAAPAVTSISFTAFSLDEIVQFVPLALLTIFGLLILALIEVAPWVVRAWVSPAARRNEHSSTIIWIREDSQMRS